jgi:hypothetical protein
LIKWADGERKGAKNEGRKIAGKVQGIGSALLGFVYGGREGRKEAAGSVHRASWPPAPLVWLSSF